MIALSLVTSAMGQNNQSPPPGNAAPKDSVMLESQQGKPSFVPPPNTCINMSMEQWNQLQSDIRAIRDQLNELKGGRDEMRKMMMDRRMPPPGDMQKPN